MGVIWEAPANIALIKYWGKKELQIPQNPSLSFTLRKSRTTTSVKISNTLKKGSWKFSYEGQPKTSFEAKIQTFFNRIRSQMPFLDEVGIQIDSSNNFPHSSGISSSASFYSSLALALCDLESQFTGKQQENNDFLKRASSLARLGSGSAARSVFGNIVTWGESELEGSSNLFASPLTSNIHKDFFDYHDAILVINSAAKPMSSSIGHGLMEKNPYSTSRYDKARTNFKELLLSLQSGDKASFIDIVEHEAQTLHGLILSSKGGSILLKPNTLKAIELIKNHRIETGSKCCFTLDAGPNIHLLYPKDEKEEIQMLIQNKLEPLCENGRWIDDSIGNGPKKLH